MAMNQVSDTKFAIACAEVGIIPSVSVLCYLTETFAVDYHKLTDDLLLLESDIMFSMYESQVYDLILAKILKAAGVKVIEIIMPWHDYDMYKFGEAIAKLRDEGFLLFQRAVQYNPAVGRPARNGYWYPHFDGIIAKGNKGAGAITEQPLVDMIIAITKDYPDKLLIAAGGISTKKQVKAYLKYGVVAVGIGTLFAASEEACLSPTAKQKLVGGKFTPNSLPGKNALVFKHIDSNDPNHTLSLKVGLNRPDLGGHIYAGEGINNIKAIRPLKDIVAGLV